MSTGQGLSEGHWGEGQGDATETTGASQNHMVNIGGMHQKRS